MRLFSGNIGDEPATIKSDAAIYKALMAIE